MKIRLTTDRAWSGGTQFQGQVYDLPEREALALLKAHQAEIVLPEDQQSPPAIKPFTKHKRR